MKQVLRLMLFRLCGLGGCFGVFSEGGGEFIGLVAVHVCGYVYLVLGEGFVELRVCFDMRTFNHGRLHLQLNQMLPMLLII